MLSAVLKRVTSLEKRLDKQGNNLVELKNKVNGPLLTTSDNISSEEEIKDILLRYQAKLKEHDFEMNHIKSKVKGQEENVQKIKLDLIKLRSEKQRTQQQQQDMQQQAGSQQQQPQPIEMSSNTEELIQTSYHPAGECLIGRDGSYYGPVQTNTITPQTQIFNPVIQNTELGSIHSFTQNHSPRTTEAIVADRCLQESAGSDSAALWHSFTNNKVRLGTPLASGIEVLLQQQQQQHEQVQLQSAATTVRKLSSETCNNVNNRTNLQRELSFYKRRTLDLEAKCANKDRLLQELASKQEEYKEREKGFLQKLEWCEHKMRLLKQDKRRRGETIGKLLRSIDEMKDAGKLDQSRVQEGRGIIATTINTRGLSNEQRIQAAINITDTEKSPRYRELLARVRTSESSAQSDDTDGELTPRTRE